MPAPRLRLLVTRPREDAEPLARALAARGHEAVIEPLLEIRIAEGPALDLDGVQGLLLTSANGVRAVARRTPRRDLPVWAVGDATARAARGAGFGQVESAAGAVEDLARLIVARCDPSAGRLVHAAGTAVAGDLSELLAQAGFTVDRQVLYAAEAAEDLSPGTVSRLYAGTIDAILFFSPRTARSFVRLAGRAGLSERLGPVTAFCLSEAVAHEVRTLGWGAVRTAPRPDQASLLALIDPLVETRREPGSHSGSPKECGPENRGMRDE
ncbi:uroporphyrinogen-III synthase [Arenibaculum pallidiluteum]|uniref:uroporphyrinogen-III synthase n=1 Tax=Arenibaculum pallidiluteum TaxID=2812559 RepID=UPI002E2E4BBB|nr:uroporphyrinogen-III synthase [Arenibaculum pallidiluteum]